MPWITVHGHRINVGGNGAGRSEGPGLPKGHPAREGNPSAPTNTLNATGQRVHAAKRVTALVESATGKKALVESNKGVTGVSVTGGRGEDIHKALSGDGWVPARAEVHPSGPGGGEAVTTSYVHPDYSKVFLTHRVLKDAQGVEKHHSLGIMTRAAWGDPSKE